MEPQLSASSSSPLLLRMLSALAVYQNRLSDELAKTETEYEKDPPKAITTATRISLQQRRVAYRMRLIGDCYIADLAALQRTLSQCVDTSGLDHGGGSTVNDGFLVTPPQSSTPQGAVVVPQTPVRLDRPHVEGSRPSSSVMSRDGVGSEGTEGPCTTPSPPGSTSISTASSEMSLQEHNSDQCPSPMLSSRRQSARGSGSGRRSTHKKCEVSGCTRLARGVGPKGRRCASHGGGRRCFCGRVARGASNYCGTHGGGRRCHQEGCSHGAAGASDYCVTHGGGKRCTVPQCSKATCGKSDRCFEHGGGRRCGHLGCNRGAVGITEYCIRHGGGKRCEFEGCTKGAVSGGMCVRHGNMTNRTPARIIQAVKSLPDTAVVSPGPIVAQSFGQVLNKPFLGLSGSSCSSVVRNE